MNASRLGCRHAKCRAGPQIKPGSVSRTLNLMVDKFAIGERPAIVGADIGDAEKLSANPDNQHQLAADFADLSPPIRDRKSVV